MQKEAELMLQKARTHLLESAAVKHKAIDCCLESIIEAANLITASFQAKGKLLLCGNGGSAADCQHMAAEFVSRLTKDFERPALPAIALTTDTSFLTAFTNDYGFADVFARQVEALGAPGDILLGISTSGNSINVNRAFKSAKAKKMKTVLLTGDINDNSAKVTDVVIAVPSHKTQYIQETHLAIEHILCEIVEHSLIRANDG